MTSGKDTIFMNIGIEAKKALKILSATEGKTMKELIIEMIMERQNKEGSE